MVSDDSLSNKQDNLQVRTQSWISKVTICADRKPLACLKLILWQVCLTETAGNTMHLILRGMHLLNHALVSLGSRRIDRQRLHALKEIDGAHNEIEFMRSAERDR